MIKKNIVFFYCDQFLWNATGYAGNKQVKTPNLDRLAETAVNFTNTYSVSPVCVPARVAMLSGKYPHHTGVFTNHDIYRPDTLMLTKILQENQYHTGGIGKYHFLGHASAEDERHIRRFDTVRLHDGVNQHSEYCKHLASIDPQLAEFDIHANPKENTGGSIYGKNILNNDKKCAGIIYGDSQLKAEHFYTQWISDESIDYIEQNHKKPFFMYVSFCGPHSPFLVPEPYNTMYNPDEIELPENWMENHEHGIRAHAWQHSLYGTRHLTEEQLRKITALYYGHITLIDEHIGRIMNKLDELNLRDNTIIAFSADHGELLGNHGMMYKSVMYDESLRVPLLISDAGQKSGFLRKSFVSQIDIMPTLLDMAGIKIPDCCDGKSMKSLQEGDENVGRTEIFAEIGKDQNMGYIFGYRNKDYLFALHIKADGTSSGVELYDLNTDPGQNRNLSESPEFSVLIEKFKNKIILWLADTSKHELELQPLENA